MTARRRARADDVHELARQMPHVRVAHGPKENPIYSVGGKSFIFFRTPRPDAVDPETGQRYPDVIVFWVPSDADKQALVQDPASPFFTTAHFDGHLSVLARASRIGELSLAGDESWEAMVPGAVAELIKRRSFFGYRAALD